MAARAEVRHDGTIGREKTLGMAWRFEPLHPLLPLASRLVGVLGAIIEIPMLAMFHARKHLSLSCSVALEFVGDDHPRYVREPFQEFTEELLGLRRSQKAQ